MDSKDLTPTQRALLLYIELSKGQVICLSDWARRVGVSRQAVFRQMGLMSLIGIPVVQLDVGKWVLQEYAERYAKWDNPA